mmetsp:Transcript_12957/g.39121  ORF Transcript_12957/g.39121 Transcript_12957/m.39121 type:complete len:358 (-) Transcript_12957:1338-2411(-)
MTLLCPQLLLLLLSISRGATLALQTPIQQRAYRYDSWRLSYKFAPGSKELPAIVLVHPIGIGLGSWFWTPLIEALGKTTNAEVYAPDLIGCGDSEPWRPQERGIFIPLDYSRQLEELWRQEIQRPCVVVAQGGLAPVAVHFATRQADDWDGPRNVERVALASPPGWPSLSRGAQSRDNVLRSYAAWSSRVGQAAYDVLRRRPFVEFFSNAFLFAESADDEWLRECCDGATRPGAENPVFAFNAGIVNVRGLGEEMTAFMTQPVLLLEGERDAKRKPSRDDYVAALADCQRVTVKNGLNVLPWEQPDATARALARFCGLSEQSELAALEEAASSSSSFPAGGDPYTPSSAADQDLLFE